MLPALQPRATLGPTELAQRCELRCLAPLAECRRQMCDDLLVLHEARGARERYDAASRNLRKRGGHRLRRIARYRRPGHAGRHQARQVCRLAIAAWNVAVNLG